MYKCVEHVHHVKYFPVNFEWSCTLQNFQTKNSLNNKIDCTKGSKDYSCFNLNVPFYVLVVFEN